jgi:hypothetical protein
MHLGHAIGTMLDDRPWYASGIVRVARRRQAEDLYEVALVRPDKWLCRTKNESWVSDGTTTAIRRKKGEQETQPAKLGWVHQSLHTFFPIAAPIWGRGSDDWRMKKNPVLQGDLLTVALEDRDDEGYSASVVIDINGRRVVAMGFPDRDIELLEMNPDPPAAEMFEIYAWPAGPVRREADRAG